MKTKQLIEKYNSVSEKLSVYSYSLDNFLELNQEEYFEYLTGYYYLLGKLELLTEMITDRCNNLSYEVEYDYTINNDTGTEYSIIKSVKFKGN